MGVLEPLLRNARFGKWIGLAAALLVMLVWWKTAIDPGKVVARHEASGRIVERHPKTYVVELASGQRVRVFRLTEHAQGDVVTLVMERHESGDVFARLPGMAKQP
ncbi:hypothetical protein [Chitinimonas sp. BJYL2]|uniref:hypothetical protein n=1 Tax=Chitinimonas sp. BJYL2 TaxID=2976696 RepID=UPI0022B470BF|nr:hypothetical protein [Chitinimonas sp. BJYL2]